jgi:hypothetical protein
LNLCGFRGFESHPHRHKKISGLAAIFLSVIKRRNAGTWEWDNARQLAARLEEAGSWTVQVAAHPPSALEAPRKQTRITIAADVKVFLSNREGAKIAPSTL